MRAKAFIFICLCLLLAAVYVLQAPAAKQQRKRYVNKKAGFRVQLPPGWRKIKSNELSSLLAVFAPKDESVMVTVFRHVGSVNPRDAMARIDKVEGALSSRKISEETTVVSGLPARKVTYAASPGGQATRTSHTFVFSQGEIWILMVTGPERLLVTPEEPRYQELQQLMGSFEFLEPVLGRLKAGLTIAGAAGTTVEEVAGGQRYYINDNLGMKILLPPDWVMLSEQVASFLQPTMVILGKQRTMARVVLVREVLEASPALYMKLTKKQFYEKFLQYRLISEEKVSRGGLEGRSFIIRAREDDIQLRYWIQVFSAGDEHFRISAFAPEEVFERYADAFKEMMRSVQFPGLVNRLPATDTILPEQGGSLPGTELGKLKQAVARNPGDVKARRWH